MPVQKRPTLQFLMSQRLLDVAPVGVLVLAVIVLGIVGSSAFSGARQLAAVDESAERRRETIRQLDNVLRSSLGEESGSRGFALTGDESFLEPYWVGRAQIVGDLARLDSLMSTEPATATSVQMLRALLERRQVHTDSMIALRRAGNIGAAHGLIASGRGRALMDSVRAQLGVIEAEERRQLRALVDAARLRRASDQTRGAIESILAVLLLLSVVWVLEREIRRRRRHSAKISHFNDELEKRIELARRELAASEARLQGTLDGLSEGCLLLDRELRFLYVNPAAAQQVRRPVHAMLGHRVEMIFPAILRTPLSVALARALELGESSFVPFRYTFPDGTTGHFHARIEPVPEGVFLLTDEVTDQVDGDRALFESESQHRALLQGLPESVFLLDAKGMVLDLHVPKQTHHPLDRDALLGRHFAEALPPSVTTQVTEILHRIVATGLPESLLYRVDASTGARRYGATMVANDDQRLTVVVRDETERIALEEQLRQSQKMEALGQLTGGIAHDFNNVLTAISVNAEMMAMVMPPEATARADVLEIIEAARRGAKIISHMMRFSRVGSLTLEPGDPAVVVEEVAAMLKRLLPRSVELELGHLERGTTILMDANAVEQMITNLCTNARDAMPDGGSIHIECRTVVLDASYHETHPWIVPAPHLFISIRDTGMGMDEATQRRIFEPFFTTKAIGLGTGLGLSMVYGLMKSHGGMVQVYSEPGLGTELKLFFPLADSPATRARAATTQEPVTIAGGTEVILVVEDDPAIRLAARRALEVKGYHVLVAEDGAQGLEQFRLHTKSISLVMTDLVMPNLGGRELMQKIREEDATVPVLITSGYSADQAFDANALPAGVHFLNKPWLLTDLYATVRSILESPARQRTQSG